MERTYAISGMTCQGCVASVKGKLEGVEGVEGVAIDLAKGEGTLEMQRDIPLEEFAKVLPAKYVITSEESPISEGVSQPTVSKWKQLKPLFLIFAYLFGAAFLLNFKAWDFQNAMMDFMGLFYVVFSFFKFLDLKGFPESFKMYDPLAKVFPLYGWIYPFLELALGLCFLMRFQVTAALWITILILGITTFGVTKTLLDKKSIRCACLGTALNLPMTEATFIENAIMLVMAFSMLF
ncbi:MAG: MauE/DoxX family redox-associated membrane protein [Bacteroidota bacterium]